MVGVIQKRRRGRRPWERPSWRRRLGSRWGRLREASWVLWSKEEQEEQRGRRARVVEGWVPSVVGLTLRRKEGRCNGRR